MMANFLVDDIIQVMRYKICERNSEKPAYTVSGYGKLLSYDRFRYIISHFYNKMNHSSGFREIH